MGPALKLAVTPAAARAGVKRAIEIEVGAPSDRNRQMPPPPSCLIDGLMPEPAAVVDERDAVA